MTFKGPYKLKAGEAPMAGYVVKAISYRMAYPKPKEKAPKRAVSKKNVTVRKPRKKGYKFAVPATGTRVTFK